MDSINITPLFQNPHLDGKTKQYYGNREIGFLLIHGFTATTVEVGFLAAYVRDQGYSFSAPLLPGHGTSPGELNKVRYQDWIDTVENSYTQLKNCCKKVIVGGESMGAVLSLNLAAKYEDISALLLFSTALRVKNLNYARLLRFFKPWIGKSNNDDEMPWQGYTVYPLKGAYEFYKLQRETEHLLNSISMPAIIFQGKYDRTIDPDSSEIVFQSITSSIKNLIEMPDSGHVMLLDKEFESIANRTMDFLIKNKILPSVQGL